MEFIDVIEELSHSKNLHQGKVLDFTKELLKTASKSMDCRRANAWLFNKDKTTLQSIHAYDRVADSFMDPMVLYKNDIPNYFKNLIQNKIIVANDALTEPLNAELVKGYLDVYNIQSMIDVPLRSEGEMVGVICFEAVDKKRKWTSAEKKFCQSMAQLLSLAIETNAKNELRAALERTVKQKEILLYEINHRVKNNMAVIIGLINLQKHKSKDDFHRELLQELKEKIHSMAVVQNHLHNNKSIVKVELSLYLEELVNNLHRSYGHGKDIELEMNMNKAVIDISKGIPLGLIANEILTNSFKYAFKERKEGNKLYVSLYRRKREIVISFEDNGSGFELEDNTEGMGLELIRDLTNQIDGELHIKVEEGVKIEIRFPII